MTQARVAIVTRTKNRPLLLERALHSVLGQTFQEWVHVIVNDGGDPAEVQRTVASYRERYGERLVVIDNPDPAGIEAASNIGIRGSRSEFVVIHDDDDSWERNFLARCVAFMDATDTPRLDCEYGGVITHSLRVDSETLGALIDRLSILSLKIFHMDRQARRSDTDASHRAMSRERLTYLLEQRADLAWCLDELVRGCREGTMRFKVYRQFKMYNDPRFSPWLTNTGTRPAG